MYFWDLEKNQLIRQEPECKSVFLGHERTELPTLSFTNWYWFDWLHYWENSRVWGGMFEGSSLCCFTVMFLFCLLLFGIAKNCILFLIPANPPSFSSTTSQNDCKFFFCLLFCLIRTPVLTWNLLLNERWTKQETMRWE